MERMEVVVGEREREMVYKFLNDNNYLIIEKNIVPDF